jgi:hypothetical protein
LRWEPDPLKLDTSLGKENRRMSSLAPTSWLLLSLVSFLGLARAFEEHGQSPLGTKPCDSVSVRLLFEDGQPAGGAFVSLISTELLLGLPLSGQGKASDATTGRVEFEGLRSGHYTLVARWKPKRGSPQSKADRRGENADLPRTDPLWWGIRGDVSPAAEEVEIMLVRGAEQVVSVKTTEDESVARVHVRLALKASNSFVPAHDSPLPPPVMLDCWLETKAGRFVLDGLVPGEWEYVFAARDYGRTEILSSSLPNEGVLQVSVPRFLTVAGEVHVPEGVSPAEVWVGIRYEDTRSWMSEDGQVATSTDVDGRFVITSARPGRATLRAESTGPRCLAELPIVIQPGKDLAQLRVELKPAK